MVADINIRRIGGLILPHQYACGFRCQSSDRLAVGVYDEPLATLFKILPARNECAHDANLQIFRKEDEQKEYEMAFSLSRRLQIIITGEYFITGRRFSHWAGIDISFDFIFPLRRAARDYFYSEIMMKLVDTKMIEVYLGTSTLA